MVFGFGCLVYCAADLVVLLQRCGCLLVVCGFVSGCLYALVLFLVVGVTLVVSAVCCSVVCCLGFVVLVFSV